MTIEINKSTSGLQLLPTARHEQGDFDLIVKQQLEKGGFQLESGKDSLSAGEKPQNNYTADQTKNSVPEFSSGGVVDEQLPAPYIEPRPPYSTNRTVAGADALRHVSSPKNEVVLPSGLAHAWFNTATATSDGSDLPILETRPGRISREADFKPVNVLVTRQGNETSLYIRDFFADEGELKEWVGRRLVEMRRESNAPTRVYINGKSYRTDITSLSNEGINHGN